CRFSSQLKNDDVNFLLIYNIFYSYAMLVEPSLWHYINKLTQWVIYFLAMLFTIKVFLFEIVRTLFTAKYMPILLVPSFDKFRVVTGTQNLNLEYNLYPTEKR